MSERKYFGLLPLTGYNYVIPSPDGGSPQRTLMSFAWFPIWNPGYGLFKYRTKLDAKGAEDYVLIELGAMTHSMYDFCGGMLTSSLKADIHEIYHERKWTGWGDRSYQRVRGEAFVMPPFAREDGGPPIIAAPGNAHHHATLSLWGGDGSSAARTWFASYSMFQTFFDVIPDATPFIGEGVSYKDLKEIARASVFAWLLHRANADCRSALVAADRTTVRPATRDILRLGSASLARRYYHYPAVGVTMDTRMESPTRGTHARCTPYSIGTSACFAKYTKKARFHGGARYVNRNSGHNVSISTTVVPALEFLQVAPVDDYFPIPAETWKPLIAPSYVQLFPNSPFHNG